jgi:hypothetical protein
MSFAWRRFPSAHEDERVRESAATVAWAALTVNISLTSVFARGCGLQMDPTCPQSATYLVATGIYHWATLHYVHNILLIRSCSSESHRTLADPALLRLRPLLFEVLLNLAVSNTSFPTRLRTVAPLKIPTPVYDASTPILTSIS